jgi:hypothetical protein
MFSISAEHIAIAEFKKQLDEAGKRYIENQVATLRHSGLPRHLGAQMHCLAVLQHSLCRLWQ